MIKQIPLLTLFIAILFCVLFTACSSDSTPPTANDSVTPPDRALEISYLKLGMDSTLIPMSAISILSLNSIRRVAPNGDSALGFRVYYGQNKVDNGIRAEASCDFPYLTGDSVVYSWELFIPSTYQSTMDMGTWCIMAQWHDQPDTTLGETWETHPAMSPPISINYLPLNGGDHLGLRSGAWPNINDIGSYRVARNEWIKLKAAIRWSQGTNGSVNIYINDTLRISATGPNMNNNFQHFFKYGMYREPSIPSDNWIYLRGLKITKF